MEFTLNSKDDQTAGELAETGASFEPSSAAERNTDGRVTSTTI